MANFTRMGARGMKVLKLTSELSVDDKQNAPALSWVKSPPYSNITINELSCLLEK
jgi:hypothetical protein